MFCAVSSLIRPAAKRYSDRAVPLIRCSTIVVITSSFSIVLTMSRTVSIFSPISLRISSIRPLTSFTIRLYSSHSSFIPFRASQPHIESQSKTVSVAVVS